MQTTLLGLAIALILALMTALIGPYFIDWNTYRPRFEAEASRLAGFPVRVRGALDARLLPSPSLTLGDVELGREGDNTVRARALAIEFELGPLLRGQWRASDMRLIGPEISLGLDRAGQLVFPKVFEWVPADTLSIDRLAVEDARITLDDAASGKHATLEKLSFNGEVRSLAGSFRGEGAFRTSGELIGYRIAASRQDEGVRLRFSLDAAEQPILVEGDGAILKDDMRAKFDGSLTLSRPAGTALVGGRVLVRAPWRVSAQVKATSASALFEHVEFQYGGEDRALKLAGTAEMILGRQPRLEGVLSARQLDVDRLVASNGQAEQLPLAAIKALTEGFGRVTRSAMPVQLGVSIDTVLLGGAPVQSLRGDLKSDSEGWLFDDVEFNAPGLTRVRLAGRADLSDGAMSFSGPADVATADPRALLVWLYGRTDLPHTGMKPMRLRGDVSIDDEKVAVERFRAEIDRKTAEGRLAYFWPAEARKARLDAQVKAAELDIDSLSEFARTALRGQGFDRPEEISAALDIDHAHFAGLDAHNVSARIKSDAHELSIERLAVGEFGGVAFGATGRIDLRENKPRGHLAADLDAKNLSGLHALVTAFAPSAGDAFRRISAQTGQSKLRATLDLAPAEQERTRARLTLEGHIGALGVKLDSEGVGTLADAARASVKAHARIDAADGATLMRLLRLDQMIGSQRQPATLNIDMQGPLDGGLRMKSEISGTALNAGLSGMLRYSPDGIASGNLDLSVKHADLGQLRSGAGALPLRLNSKVAIAGQSITLDALAGSLADAALKGKLALTLAQSPVLDGQIEIAMLNMPSAVAALVGMPATTAADSGWSTEPFTAGMLGGGLFSDISGQVTLRAAQVAVTPSLAAQTMSAILRLSPSSVALENVEGSLGNGKLAGSASLRKNSEGLAAKLHFALTGADAAAVLPGDGRSVSGKLTLQLDAEGSGRSPRALVGSLGGSGAISLTQAQIAGMNAQVFPALIRAADRGLPIDATRVHDAALPVLDAGVLKMAQADGALSMSGGQLRLSTLIARGEGAEVAAAGSYNLIDNVIDARVTLTGVDDSTSAGRPALGIALRGPAALPKRTVDAAVMSGWLALRSVEQQAKKLEMIEAERARAPAPRPEAVVPAPPKETAPKETAAPKESTPAPVQAPRSELPPQPPAPPRAEPQPQPRSDPSPAPAAPAQARAPERAGELAPLPPPSEIGPLPGARRLAPAPARALPPPLTITPQIQ